MAYTFRELRRDVTRRNTPVQRWLDGWLWQRRNAKALSTSDPDPVSLRVVFSIPLISRRGARDWSRVQTNLNTTLASLRHQTDPRWHAIVCSQDAPEISPPDPRVTYLPFKEWPEGYDKHQKSAAIRDHIARDVRGAGYFFPLDADDLLHPDLVQHILSDDNRAGYQIGKGFMLDHASMHLAVLQPPDEDYPDATHFYRSCGSSSAIWFDFDCGADFATVLFARGNHRKVVRNMGYLGFSVEAVPFHAGIYVMNHGDNLRQKRGMMSGKMKHFELNPVRDEAMRRTIGEAFRLADLYPGRWPGP